MLLAERPLLSPCSPKTGAKAFPWRLSWALGRVMGGQAVGLEKRGLGVRNTEQEDDITWKGRSPSLSSQEGEGETGKEKVLAGWLGGLLLL